MCAAQPTTRIHGRIPRQTDALSDGDSFEFEGASVDILEIPGHTLGAIAFITEGNLFSGDTLFIAGCGRVFEGTMQMMSESLDKLRKLPADTKVWCGHEYTVNNLRFARTVEPDNQDIAQALEEAVATREAKRFTVPGSLGRELETTHSFVSTCRASPRGATRSMRSEPSAGRRTASESVAKPLKRTL